ncbi:hypothetical protein CXG81DRAFT_26873 [Caulochytrium protostelioides]|uniref:Uncharacterized protein n=1 Tax=Caulochytrium protostelioides TaxID=1555241 RepID=A0A4P9X5J5_9FUNG|nr:hypothetical protein CXG81DRAFT_26873 [Caulochytrium protostelioides]|eukprot:RKP00407.1 hypothetical protein CXG81DRAFT_26873 [Caulochytrium protostelioides]
MRAPWLGPRRDQPSRPLPSPPRDRPSAVADVAPRPEDPPAAGNGDGQAPRPPSAPEKPAVSTPCKKQSLSALVARVQAAEGTADLIRAAQAPMAAAAPSSPTPARPPLRRSDPLHEPPDPPQERTAARWWARLAAHRPALARGSPLSSFPLRRSPAAAPPAAAPALALSSTSTLMPSPAAPPAASDAVVATVLARRPDIPRRTRIQTPTGSTTSVAIASSPRPSSYPTTPIIDGLVEPVAATTATPTTAVAAATNRAEACAAAGRPRRNAIPHALVCQPPGPMSMPPLPSFRLGETGSAPVAAPRLLPAAGPDATAGILAISGTTEHVLNQPSATERDQMIQALCDAMSDDDDADNGGGSNDGDDGDDGDVADAVMRATRAGTPRTMTLASCPTPMSETPCRHDLSGEPTPPSSPPSSPPPSQAPWTAAETHRHRWRADPEDDAGLPGRPLDASRPRHGAPGDPLSRHVPARHVHHPTAVQHGAVDITVPVSPWGSEAAYPLAPSPVAPTPGTPCTATLRAASRSAGTLVLAASRAGRLPVPSYGSAAGATSGGRSAAGRLQCPSTSRRCSTLTGLDTHEMHFAGPPSRTASPPRSPSSPSPPPLSWVSPWSHDAARHTADPDISDEDDWASAASSDSLAPDDSVSQVSTRRSSLIERAEAAWSSPVTRIAASVGATAAPGLTMAPSRRGPMPYPMPRPPLPPLPSGAVPAPVREVSAASPPRAVAAASDPAPPSFMLASAATSVPRRPPAIRPRTTSLGTPVGADATASALDATAAAARGGVRERVSRTSVNASSITGVTMTTLAPTPTAAPTLPPRWSGIGKRRSRAAPHPHWDPSAADAPAAPLLTKYVSLPNLTTAAETDATAAPAEVATAMPRRASHWNIPPAPLLPAPPMPSERRGRPAPRTATSRLPSKTSAETLLNDPPEARDIDPIPPPRRGSHDPPLARSLSPSPSVPTDWMASDASAATSCRWETRASVTGARGTAAAAAPHRRPWSLHHAPPPPDTDWGFATAVGSSAAGLASDGMAAMVAGLVVATAAASVSAAASGPAPGSPQKTPVPCGGGLSMSHKGAPASLRPSRPSPQDPAGSGERAIHVMLRPFASVTCDGRVVVAPPRRAVPPPVSSPALPGSPMLGGAL